MASELDWSHDYCLSCDKQTSEGAYCSQACRLADLEKAGASEPSSPLSYSSPTPGGFYLPPAVNFAAYRSISAPTSPGVMPSGQSSYFTQTPLPKRALSTSSSRSSLSLSSIPSTSASTAQGLSSLSSQARTQLRSYVSSFDQVRDLKRRLTVI